MGSTDEQNKELEFMECVCAFLENKPQIAGLGNVVLRAPHLAYTFFDRPF